MTESSTDRLPAFARALGAIPSGLFIATAGSGAQATGTLVSFVQQVGFEPPVVTVAVKKGRPLESLVRDGGRFCIGVLDKASSGLLGHFAKGFDPGEPAFDGVATATDDAGVPYLTDAVAWLSCKVVGEADWTDHVLFAGEVVAGGRRDDGSPMVHLRKNGLSY
jgi:flavin reductase (DIM6/NTAB) family NADH-FMN oxidoreductase RutF